MDPQIHLTFYQRLRCHKWASIVTSVMKYNVNSSYRWYKMYYFALLSLFFLIFIRDHILAVAIYFQHWILNAVCEICACCATYDTTGLSGLQEHFGRPIAGGVRKDSLACCQLKRNQDHSSARVSVGMSRFSEVSGKWLENSPMRFWQSLYKLEKQTADV